ncbi:DUF2238 domain-containing protein [Pontibacter sp. E15-1]|uniref:DUF2238 domain-containing protein n=1 Tax=Pontibacter sp. E15-1 TaxID=2919918 RepID=UPI001F4F8EF4|nr:DUF2238 domain-containing protein [Pontibacter sp. E15-1]MCJ8165608.1 DUF2238 domain-containing protein [Pontibacter sp. E15-1]
MIAHLPAKTSFLRQPLHLCYSVLFAAFWLYTGLSTPDLKNWLLENTLSMVILLVAFYNILRFSDTSYTLIFLFLLLHVYGSQYQYAENPFGEWLKVQWHLQRNHYDRIVHLGFGLLLAYPMHEVFARGLGLRNFLGYLLPVEFILSLSALYELVEWLVADVAYDGARQGMVYLGMQGDVWDAQKDMGLAFIGALLAMCLTLILRRKRVQAVPKV